MTVTRNVQVRPDPDDVLRAVCALEMKLVATPIKRLVIGPADMALATAGRSCD